MSSQTISESATYNRRVAQRKRCLLPVTELVGAGCESADARNLSASGIFLETGAGVPVGTTVQGRVTLPLGIDPASLNEADWMWKRDLQGDPTLLFRFSASEE